MKKIALDIDDVLAGFYPGMCKRFNRPETRINIWDGLGESQWVAELCPQADCDPEFWLGLDVVSNPNSITFDFECYITSSPKDMLDIRKQWLISKGFPDRPVYYSENKLMSMRQLEIDILVDDKPSTVDTVNKSYDKWALQFKPSYMSVETLDRSKIITHLSEVNKFI